LGRDILITPVFIGLSVKMGPMHGIVGRSELTRHYAPRDLSRPIPLYSLMAHMLIQGIQDMMLRSWIIRHADNLNGAGDGLQQADHPGEQFVLDPFGPDQMDACRHSSKSLSRSRPVRFLVR